MLIGGPNFSGLEGVSGVIRRLRGFGGPIEEKVSDLGGLEGLEGSEGLEGCYPAQGTFRRPYRREGLRSRRLGRLRRLGNGWIFRFGGRGVSDAVVDISVALLERRAQT